ncbi:uncharacterized protein MELLADRAFT_78659 [Melampsora larici-populina 98AG31]|uniref:JmjC domain-containing protein n=1 Tax=Melampsora larici-populina (strain 98AG31 / pathotype 3-4-7) TaxID=747676 RepID=F4RWY5_MELLP|nr:uncharacterized protein MELLADRAFT_78659 [Melampsora larici-populina 98AG31]EGG03103.1 hypothetical protein MELLADRAFT_78659 [Melampsora larici-populina 98AG31]
MVVHWRLLELWNRIKDLQVQSNPSKSITSHKVLIDDILTISDGLITYADEKILSYPYKEVPTYYRQLYTDAILIKTTTIWAYHQTQQDSSNLSSACSVDWSEIIRMLDMALIVAGAPGKGRRETLFFLIQSIQNTYLADLKVSSSDEEVYPPHKKIRIENPSSLVNTQSDQLPSLKAHPTTSDLRIHQQIPTYNIPPTPNEFVNKLYQCPFVIKGYCSNWNSLKSNPWREVSYLKKVSGPFRVVPVEVGGKYTDEKWGQRIISWYEFLDSIKLQTLNPISNFASNSSDQEVLYLAQYDLFQQFPTLRHDISIPEYVDCEIPEIHGQPRLRPSAEDGLILNAWLGPGGTVSPAHVDPYYNCYAQIVGQKFVWVASPKFQSEMYPFGSSSVLAGESTPNLKPSDQEKQDECLQTSFMKNTTQVDVLMSCDPKHDQLDSIKERFPDFVDKVMPEAMQIVLEEGDLMVMPPGWWHSMKSLSPSISVSIWF